MKEYSSGLPPQQLSFRSKTKQWRIKCVDWADSRSFFNYSPVMKSITHKKINYDLLNGILHMNELESFINPDDIEADFIPTKINHYPIMNSKLRVLQGEESKRLFDYKAIVTNPNSISQIEEEKKNQMFAMLQQMILDQSSSEDEFNAQLEKMDYYFRYEYQDFREIRANALMNHYSKEYNFPEMFNEGFVDAYTVGEEIYQCDIISGEPVVERINPTKISVFRSGYSDRIEDADVIIIQDYWNPGRIIDTFGDVLTAKDRKYIETLVETGGDSDSMGNTDDKMHNIAGTIIEGVLNGATIDTETLFTEGFHDELMPFDMLGNIKVLRVYWKSRRKIKKIKSFDVSTGEEVIRFMPETYQVNEELGEEEQVFWINEAWEGTKIGKDVYVNMRPRIIQYNRMSNPSRCHFGIIGSIYNINQSQPFSLVDMMKQYNYQYDVIHDRLSRLIARNWGKLVKLDLAMVPDEWDVEQWLYFARTNGIAVTDSFKEGNSGQAQGVLAASLNSNANGVIDAELGNTIQQYMNLLEFIKLEMSEVVGITKQREGQIANRETVGGVERATLQSSYITEWLFFKHDDVKKRVLEAFIETAKIAMKGRNKKFQYTLSDGSQKVMEIDGDEFAENDYGIVVDNGNGVQELAQKLDVLAQAALQNQTLSFSTIMKLYSSCSLIEKQRFVEKDENDRIQREMQMQQMQLQQQQEETQALMQQKQMEMEQEDMLNARDNETKIQVAQIQAATKLAGDNNDDGIPDEGYSQEAKDNLLEKMRQFDKRLAFDKEKFQFEKEKAKTDARLKEKQINKQSKTSKK